MEGLTTSEVEERINKGLINEDVSSSTRTVKEIVKENVLTYFNLIFAVLAVLLIIVGQFKDLTFLFIVAANTIIGIAQEIRSKQILDNLKFEKMPRVTVIRDGAETEIATEELVQDDVVILGAGSGIPADAEIVSGDVQVNEALVTGESDEISKTAGDKLLSGSFIISGECHARLTAVGKDSYISRLTVEATRQGKKDGRSEMVRSLDKLVMIIGFLIIPIGIVLFVQQFYVMHNTFSASVTSMVAAVLGMVPEGLYMLASVALVVSAMRLAKQEVLVQNMRSIETLARVDVLCVDKTGTITSGQPVVTDLYPCDGFTEASFLALAAALENHSEHPLARAVLALANERSVVPAEVENFQALPGNGLSAMLKGKRLTGGSLAYISSLCPLPESVRREAEALAASGKTPMLFLQDGRPAGIIAVADPIKPDSRKAVEQLKALGIRVVMLTGDNEKTAKAIAAQAGIDEVVAGVLPDGKERVMRKLMQEGKVAMVGDGINDAPALTRADTGIAIGAGTDVALDAADVVLMKSNLLDVPAAIRLSRATLRNIRENLFWAFFYNVIGIPLAAGVWYPLFGLKLNPMFGAAAMSLSSFCVVSNALRLNWFRLYDASKDKPVKHKKIKEVTSMEKTMRIEGMMCMHCEATVKKALEALDGVSAAEVSHEKGTAVVTLSAPVADEVLKKAVEEKDYTVTSIS